MSKVMSVVKNEVLMKEYNPRYIVVLVNRVLTVDNKAVSQHLNTINSFKLFLNILSTGRAMHLIRLILVNPTNEKRRREIL